MNDVKPGYALADRIRERSKKARKAYQDAVRAAYPNFEEVTMPQNNLPVEASLDKRTLWFIAALMTVVVIESTILITKLGF